MRKKFEISVLKGSLIDYILTKLRNLCRDIPL